MDEENVGTSKGSYDARSSGRSGKRTRYFRNRVQAIGILERPATKFGVDVGECGGGLKGIYR